MWAGCTVTAGLEAPEVDHDEGELCVVPFDRLEEVLAGPGRRWAPSGRASLLLWLLSGAPGAGTDPRFGALEPERLLRRVLGE